MVILSHALPLTETAEPCRGCKAFRGSLRGQRAPHPRHPTGRYLAPDRGNTVHQEQCIYFLHSFPTASAGLAIPAEALRCGRGSRPATLSSRSSRVARSRRSPGDPISNAFPYLPAIFIEPLTAHLTKSSILEHQLMCQIEDQIVDQRSCSYTLYNAYL